MDEHIQAACASAEPTTKDPITGCAPWVSLNFDPLGQVAVRHRNQTMLLGDINHERLDEIWSPARLVQLSQRATRYGFGADTETTASSFYDRFAMRERQPDWPQQMTFALSNACNYACIHCSGTLSSAVRAHREKLPPLPRAYDNDFLTDLRKYLPHLVCAEFAGGEPFLTAENYRIWDMMIEDGLRTDCHVLTNASQWNARVERVLDNLDFSIGVSLDALSRERFESIRGNADFDSVMTNIAHFREYARSRGKLMIISFAWMRKNWNELGPMLLHCEEHGYNLNVIRVIDPDHLSLFTLPADELREISDRLHSQSDRILPQLNSLLAGIWTDCLRDLERATERRPDHVVLRSVTGRRTKGDAVRGRALMDKQRWAEAIAEVEKLRPADEDYLPGLFVRAHSHRRLGHLETAEHVLTEAMASALAMATRHPELYVERAWLRFDQGRDFDGLEDTRRARESMTPGDDTLECSILHARGALAARINDIDDAERCVTRWIELRPAEMWVRQECARIYEHAGWRERAVAQLEAALELEGTDRVRMACLLDLARLYRADDDVEGARDALTRATELDGDRAEMQLAWAWLYFDLGLHEESVASAERARALASTDDARVRAELSKVRGHALAKLGVIAEARSELESYLERFPEDLGTLELLEELSADAEDAADVAIGA